MDPWWRPHWRLVLDVDKKSAYDIWMSECLTAWRRGAYAPIVPSKSGGHSAAELIPAGSIPPPVPDLADHAQAVDKASSPVLDNNYPLAGDGYKLWTSLERTDHVPLTSFPLWSSFRMVSRTRNLSHRPWPTIKTTSSPTYSSAPNLSPTLGHLPQNHNRTGRIDITCGLVLTVAHRDHTTLPEQTMGYFFLAVEPTRHQLRLHQSQPRSAASYPRSSALAKTDADTHHHLPGTLPITDYAAPPSTSSHHGPRPGQGTSTELEPNLCLAVVEHDRPIANPHVDRQESTTTNVIFIIPCTGGELYYPHITATAETSAAHRRRDQIF